MTTPQLPLFSTELHDCLDHLRRADEIDAETSAMEARLAAADSISELHSIVIQADALARRAGAHRLEAERQSTRLLRKLAEIECSGQRDAVRTCCQEARRAVTGSTPRT